MPRHSSMLLKRVNPVWPNAVLWPEAMVQFKCKSSYERGRREIQTDIEKRELELEELLQYGL